MNWGCSLSNRRQIADCFRKRTFFSVILFRNSYLMELFLRGVKADMKPDISASLLQQIYF